MPKFKRGDRVQWSECCGARFVAAFESVLGEPPYTVRAVGLAAPSRGGALVGVSVDGSGGKSMMFPEDNFELWEE